MTQTFQHRSLLALNLVLLSTESTPVDTLLLRAGMVESDVGLTTGPVRKPAWSLSLLHLLHEVVKASCGHGLPDGLAAVGWHSKPGPSIFLLSKISAQISFLLGLSSHLNAHQGSRFLDSSVSCVSLGDMVPRQLGLE